MFTAGGDYSSAPTKKAMCGCTDASHQEVRDAIREQHLLTHRRASTSTLDWRTPNGCASCRPAINYYLHQHLAEGGQGRPAEPLHQRAQPRQHPEGRHLLGDPAHVGRRDHGRRAAPHRRRGRQVQDPDRQGHRRPAHRPAGREEGRPARRLEGHRHAQRPCLRQGAAHGEDLRRQRVVPLRHAGQHADGQGPGARAVAHVRAAQGQAGGVAAARATAPRPASRTSA